MSAIAEKILADALRLPEHERADLVDKLVESLDSDGQDDSIHPDWEAEIARRVADIDSGRAKLIPWSEVRRRLHADD